MQNRLILLYNFDTTNWTVSMISINFIKVILLDNIFYILQYIYIFFLCVILIGI